MTTDTVSQHAVQDSMKQTKRAEQTDPYSLWQIFGIWLAVGAPMWVLSWLADPAMSIGLAESDAALLRVKLLTVGLIWQFVLSMLILYREQGNLRLSTISHRFWLNHPVDAKTGETTLLLVMILGVVLGLA